MIPATMTEAPIRTAATIPATTMEAPIRTAATMTEAPILTVVPTTIRLMRTTRSSSTTDTSASTASSGDREASAGLIYCEAGNQSREGKVAVGAVVMNRVASSSLQAPSKMLIYESGRSARLVPDGWTA